ncbi:conserved hypothetical protein [Theileria equi strain WA]|uniref:Uncharacterized protein n=1 Tax=Theileria equi strain WA TaxID=1537102 RepID=L1LD82_THEEQ|nr:conserved hypothetical protein [Theileria equi strain WA]EKX73234.1 conserved hypothetical protein [Theileria equi strain WA]|eukprot:XP_004832686.1 conserved hypothetical protein [Theileria equi strain WA]
MHKRNPTRDRIPKRPRQPRARQQSTSLAGLLPIPEQLLPGLSQGLAPTQIQPPTHPKNRNVSVIKRKKSSECASALKHNDELDRIRSNVLIPNPPMEDLRGSGMPITPIQNFGSSHSLNPSIGMNPNMGNPLVPPPLDFMMNQHIGTGTSLGNHMANPFDNGLPKPPHGTMPNPLFPFQIANTPQILQYANTVQDFMDDKGPLFPPKNIETGKKRFLFSKHVKMGTNGFLNLPGLNRLKGRIKRLSHVLDSTTKALAKVRFALPSIFRMRYKYTLKPFEDAFLSNVELVYRFILFIHLIKGFRESVPFDLSKDSDFDENKEPTLRDKTILSFCNDSTDCSLVDVGANNGCNFNNRWVILKWNTAPSITYLKYFLDHFDYGKGGSKRLVFIRMINVDIIAENIELIKELSRSDEGIEEQFLQMLCYYCIVCNDESYITFISSILPSLSRSQSVCFYENIANLLDKTKCNLQTRYLECFIERILPICLSHDSEHWRHVIRGVVNILNPLRLGTRKKYTACAVTLLRSLKSYCENFVKCELTTCVVFHACLKYILQSSDDSCILIRGEAADLAIQIWLNEDGKRHVLGSLGYDSVRILGAISGIQSVKLNIWSDLLKNYTTFSISRNSDLFCMRNENLLFIILSNSEDIFSVLQFLEYKEASRICEILNTTKLNYHALFWFMNKYLRATKTSLALEKISTIIRFAFLCFPAFIRLHYEGLKGVDSSYSMNKFLNGTTVLGPFVNWMLTMATNTGNVGACLEIANIKISIFIDWLFYCHKFNSILLKHTNRSGLVKVTMSTSSNANFLLNCYLNSRPIIQNLVRSLNLPFVATIVEEQNSSGTEDATMSTFTDILGVILDSTRHFKKSGCARIDKDNGFSIVEKYDGEETRRLWALLQADNPLTILAASELLVFSFNSNVEFGRLLIDYLLHSIWNYCPDKVAVLSLGVISSIVACSLLVLILNKSRVNTLQSLIKELKRTILGKLCLIYNIGLEYLHIKIMRIPFEYVNDFKSISASTSFEVLTLSQELHGTSYAKVCSITDKKDQFCYENLLKYVIFQSFSLTLEFYMNFEYFMINGPANGTFIGKAPIPSFITNDIDNEPEEHKIIRLILELSYPSSESSVERLLHHLNTKLDDSVFPNYILQCSDREYDAENINPAETDSERAKKLDTKSDDELTIINSIRCSFRSPQRPGEDLDTCSQYMIGFTMDVIATLLTLCTLDNCAHNYCNTRRDSLFSLAYLDSNLLIDTLSNVFAQVSMENDKFCWELLYYIVSTSAAFENHKYGCKGTLSQALERFCKYRGLGNENACDGTFLFKKANIMTKVFLSSLSRISEMKRQPINDLLNAILERCIERSIDYENANGEAQLGNFSSSVEKLMPIRLVLEIIIHSNILWPHFRAFPSILMTLLKVSPVSTLASFLSSFSFLHTSNCYYLLGSSKNSHFNPFKHMENLSTAGDVENSDRANKDLEEYVRYILLKNTDVCAMNFRRYFISWQLLIRMYELEYCTKKMHMILRTDRGFLKNFTTGIISFDQLDDMEYLSGDSLHSTSNYEQIMDEDCCICYIGSSNTRSNFMIFSEGYTFSTPYDIFSSTNLHILSRILLDIVNMKNTRLTQVAIFSLFPVFIASAPTEPVLHHVLLSFNYLDLDRNSKAAILFMKYILLTVILNWFYRYSITFYYFTSTSFIDGKHKLVLDTDFVSRYVDRYCGDGSAVEFSFNYTTSKIPLEFVQTFLHIFN